MSPDTYPPSVRSPFPRSPFAAPAPGPRPAARPTSDGLPPVAAHVPPLPRSAPAARTLPATPPPAASGPLLTASVPPSLARRLLGLLLLGAAVSLSLGAFGRLHTPAGAAVDVAGFSGPSEAKAWLGTAAFGLAVVQLISALALHGRLPFRAPSWTGRLHRWSGRVAFLAAIPVAMHCLYALGLQSYDLRVLVHSVTGCLFFGAFTVKMVTLSRSGLPGWLLPLLGGTVFAGLTVLWLTSSFWFFTTVGVRF